MPESTSKASMSRRGFLVGASSLLILPSARSAFGYPAHDRLNLAIVGVSGYAAGTAFVPGVHLYDNAAISALCYVDLRKVAPAYMLWEERARGTGPSRPRRRSGGRPSTTGAWPRTGRRSSRATAGSSTREVPRSTPWSSPRPITPTPRPPPRRCMPASRSSARSR